MVLLWGGHSVKLFNLGIWYYYTFDVIIFFNTREFVVGCRLSVDVLVVGIQLLKQIRKEFSDALHAVLVEGYGV